MKHVLPASPNWYCSSISDCSLTGIYAFGARSCIYLMDVNCDPPEFKGQLHGHSERVTAVSFSKHILHAALAASGADDKVVKVWDVEVKLPVAEHRAHQVRKERFDVMCARVQATWGSRTESRMPSRVADLLVWWSTRCPF